MSDERIVKKSDCCYIIKNIHKRVRRLVELQLIEELDTHFERGAKHYKITLYGLISYFDYLGVEQGANTILRNKDSILIKSLVLQFFKEETIHSKHFIALIVDYA
jgi:hypothetical protein